MDIHQLSDNFENIVNMNSNKIKQLREKIVHLKRILTEHEKLRNEQKDNRTNFHMRLVVLKQQYMT